MKNYELLKEYYEEFGELPPQSKEYKGKTLGKWFDDVKKAYRKNTLPQERIDLLDQIDPNWKEDPRELRWMKNYELLKEYYEEFGELIKRDTMYKKIKLGSWLKEQKTHFRKNTLPQERIDLLDQIDPFWKDPKKIDN